ncbi:hypothetical protein M378DRAFT_113791, partial [Amanita muscaria Koide BX008]
MYMNAERVHSVLFSSNFRVIKDSNAHSDDYVDEITSALSTISGTPLLLRSPRFLDQSNCQCHTTHQCIYIDR